MELDISERIDFLLDLIAADQKIAYWCFDANHQLLESTSDDERIFSMVFQEMHYLNVVDGYIEKNAPIILQGDMDLTWIIVRRYRDDGTLTHYHALGPFYNSLIPPDLSAGLPARIEEKIWSEKWRTRFIAAMSRLPAFPSLVYSRYALALHYCVTGERLHTSDLIYPTARELSLLPGGMDEEPARQHLLGHRRLNVLLKMLEDGDMNYRLFLYSEENVLPIRSYAETPLQNAQIACAIFTAICTRAAMKGGLTYAASVSIEDAYIRSIFLCKTIEAVTDTKNQMYEDLIHRVHNMHASHGYSPMVQSSCDYITMHLAEPLDIGILAARLNYAKYYLSRKFKEETGDSVNTYIKKARIELAKVLLLNSDDNMDEIAVKCGFISRSFFTTAFTKECGMPPAKYRASMRRD